jgi:4-hydroxy-3-methylbut-2-enyl diphosphate reductase
MPHLQEFAQAHELIFFVSGQKSSNGRILYHECQKVNPNTHFVSRPEDIEKSLLKDIQSVGVCGATSTPKSLMEACRKRILNLSEDEAKHNP